MSIPAVDIDALFQKLVSIKREPSLAEKFFRETLLTEVANCEIREQQIQMALAVILPEHRIVVFDEAHKIEDIAREIMSTQVSSSRLPITEAKVKAIERAGGNAFFDYSMPEAIIRLKQGFGRLIRIRQDKGIVAILDPRVKSKGYGRRFLNSLPRCREISSLENVDLFLKGGQ